MRNSTTPKITGIATIVLALGFFVALPARAETVYANDVTPEAYDIVGLSPQGLNYALTNGDTYEIKFTSTWSGTYSVTFYDDEISGIHSQNISAAIGVNVIAFEYGGPSEVMDAFSLMAVESPAEVLGSMGGELLGQFGSFVGYLTHGNPLEAPTASVLIPTENAFIEEPTINALGADPYFFRAVTDVSNTITAVSGVMEIDIIGEDGVTVICHTEAGVSDSNADGFNHYGGVANHVVNGQPDPCAPLGVSSPTKHYSARARFTLTHSSVTYETGPWSPLVNFTVVPVGFIPPVDCSVAEGVRNDITCAVQGLVSFLFTPSQSSVTGVFNALNGFKTRWPISWISGTIDAFIAATDVESDDLGAVAAGNMTTAPNMAWWSEKMRSFYGDWLGGGFIAAIWIGTAIAIARTGLTMLGIDQNENDHA